MRRFALISVFVVLFALPVTAASAASGTLLVISDTTLGGNHNGSIEMTADGVTLDCAGLSVTGPGSGIRILAQGRTHVSIVNCVVSGFDLGIFYVGSSSGNIAGNTAFNNANQGIALNTADTPMRPEPQAETIEGVVT